MQSLRSIKLLRYYVNPKSQWLASVRKFRDQLKNTNPVPKHTGNEKGKIQKFRTAMRKLFPTIVKTRERQRNRKSKIKYLLRMFVGTMLKPSDL